MPPTASVIVPTYNRPSYLGLSLLSLLRQSRNDFEILVADDGSGEETRNLVLSLKPRFSDRGMELLHFWQPDEGQRKSAIMNIAVSAASAPYLIWCDGDCILAQKYVDSHIMMAAPRRMLGGRRVMLGPSFSRSITPEDVDSGLFDSFSLRLLARYLKTGGAGDTARFNRAIRLKNPNLRRFFRKDSVTDVLGSNFSAWKRDLLAVNGYDERFIGRGCEDSELEHRLKLSGVELCSVRELAVQFHCHHDAGSLGENNTSLLEEIRRNPETWTRNGIKRQP